MSVWVVASRMGGTVPSLIAPIPHLKRIQHLLYKPRQAFQPPPTRVDAGIARGMADACSNRSCSCCFCWSNQLVQMTQLGRGRWCGPTATVEQELAMAMWRAGTRSYILNPCGILTMRSILLYLRAYFSFQGSQSLFKNRSSSLLLVSSEALFQVRNSGFLLRSDSS